MVKIMTVTLTERRRRRISSLLLLVVKFQDG